MTMLIFNVFSSIALISAVMVIRAKNPVHSVSFFIPVFCNTSGLLLLLGHDFFAMIFLVVYIGAIAVLSFFVVMMLDIKIAEIHENVLRYLPVGGIIGLIFWLEIFVILDNETIPILPTNLDTIYLRYAFYAESIQSWTNLETLGHIIYTNYLILFPVSSLILLVAMIGSIVLTVHKPNNVKGPKAFGDLKAANPHRYPGRTAFSLSSAHSFSKLCAFREIFPLTPKLLAFREISGEAAMLLHRRGVKHLAIMEREITGQTKRVFLEAVNDQDPLLRKLSSEVNSNDARSILAQDLIDLTGLVRHCSRGFLPVEDFCEFIGSLNLKKALWGVLSAIEEGLATGSRESEARFLIASITNTAALLRPEVIFPLLKTLLDVAITSGMSTIPIYETNTDKIAEALVNQIEGRTPSHLKSYHAGQIAKHVSGLTYDYLHLLKVLPSSTDLLYPDSQKVLLTEDSDSYEISEENSDSSDGPELSFLERQALVSQLSQLYKQPRPLPSNIRRETDVEEADAESGIDEDEEEPIDLNLEKFRRFIIKCMRKYAAKELGQPIPQPAELGTEDLETESFSGTEDLEVNENQGAFSAFEPTLKKFLYFLYFMDKYEDFLIPIVFGVGFIYILYILVRWGIRLVRVFATKYRPLR